MLRINLRLPHLRELAGGLLILGGLGLLFALASYHPGDPSLNTASQLPIPHNRCGRTGAYFADLAYQSIGLAAWMIPLLVLIAGLTWARNRALPGVAVKTAGASFLLAALTAGLQLASPFTPYGGAFQIGGVLGHLLNGVFVYWLNPLGATLLLAGLTLVGLFLISPFSIASYADSTEARFLRWRRRGAAEEEEPVEANPPAVVLAPPQRVYVEQPMVPIVDEVNALEARAMMAAAGASTGRDYPIESTSVALADPPPWDEEQIPIKTLAEIEPPPPPSAKAPAEKRRRSESPKNAYKLPPSNLLNEATSKEVYDTDELREIASHIKTKLEEFNVLGNVVQINPGPVVTTFEFKPDAGVKIARITNLNEDLALGLQAESVLIERIPGKPTVAIEMPNAKRETISLRQVLESDDFQESGSFLTVALGKDISGRIRITELEKMPHLLIAGTTGSGKSVMLNALILSFLYKSTPDDVRLIMVDPKRVELGIYDGIPHLLTPVITDAKKATNALRNAVTEMERRLKLLAEHGVRNIDQFNRKIRQQAPKPLSLFDEESPEAITEEPLRPLPYIVIIIDELSDLMMLERAGVEESIIRLAQMARAVGIHLVLATQRPSVDVITGLIKANLPARISFKLRTRTDSRTVLDVMGAEHLLGMGDMLFLPPGTSRLLRVHGAFVTETEINRVVDHWKQQAQPEYDATFLLAPPGEDDENEDAYDGERDPMYTDAVKVVCEMGKASTSILQRRLRLGYGRAARILDHMHREGIIGPSDGPRPRDVLRRPDWLDNPNLGGQPEL